MSVADSNAFVKPDASTPKTLGVLNIVFALGLMACGTCQGFYSLLLPIVSYANEAQDRQRVENAAKRTEALARLREDLKAEKDEQAIRDLKERIESLEAEADEPPVRKPIMAESRFRDPRFLVHFLLDLASGLLLNVLMLISGIGLVFLKGWGRSLAVVTAWAKIVRLLMIALSMTIVVAPFVTVAFAAMMEEAKAANPNAAPGQPGAEVATTIGMVMTASWWVLFVVGSIYPAITIWFLGRPSVREACRPKTQPPQEPGW